MAAINIDNITNDMNNKANTDLSNVSSSKSILTQSYRDGASFYRVYSDGWCVQGGAILGTEDANNAYYTITLLKPYPDTDYNVQMTINNPTNGHAGVVRTYQLCVNYKTETDFQLSTHSTVGIGPKNWIAFGYLS